MRLMEALQGRIRPNTGNDETRSEPMVVSKRTEVTYLKVRAFSFIPSAGLLEPVVRYGFFLEVREKGSTSIREVSDKVYKANTAGLALIEPSK